MAYLVRLGPLPGQELAIPNIPNTTQNGLAVVSVGDGQNSTVFSPGKYLNRDYAVSGLIAVPSGATNYLTPFFQSVLLGQTISLVGVWCVVRAGTSVTLTIDHNGTAVGGLSGISVTTTKGYTAATNPESVIDGDLFAPVVTAISGTPDGMTVSFVFQVTP